MQPLAEGLGVILSDNLIVVIRFPGTQTSIPIFRIHSEGQCHILWHTEQKINKSFFFATHTDHHTHTDHVYNDTQPRQATLNKNTIIE